MSTYPSDLYCDDCGTSGAMPREWYMLHASIWQQVTRDAPADLLCAGCLEERLGRRVTSDDLDLPAPAEEELRNYVAPLNSTRAESLPVHLSDLAPLVRVLSDRLRSRIEGEP